MENNNNRTRSNVPRKPLRGLFWKRASKGIEEVILERAILVTGGGGGG
jgi:hypothetical protein